MSSTTTLPKGVSQRPDGRYMARFQYQGEKFCIYDYDIENLLNRLIDLKYEVRHGIYGKECNVTVDQWFNHWLEEYKVNIVKEATVYRYNSVYKNHIMIALGDKKLKDVRPDHIQRLYNSLSGTETVIVASIVLSGMFTQAYKNQLINKNPVPMATIPKPKNEKKERRVLSVAEQDILLKYCKGHLRDLVEVSLSTGMRTGEIRGLLWSDVDIENRVIHITGSLTELNGRVFRETPKTITSRRDIPMLYNVEKIFMRKKEEFLNSEPKELPNGLTDLVFKSQRGSALSNTCYLRMLNRTVQRINDDGIEFEHVHSHALRHTFATRCIENGMPPQVLKTILGHSSLSMTMDLYAHVLPDTKAEEMQKIADLF